MRNIFIFFYLVIFSSIGSNAQQIVQKSIKVLEIVSITTDRDLYLTGENCWFASEIILENHIPTLLSSTLYIELYNEQYKVIAKQKLKITDGHCDGFIAIPNETETGNYYLRAYTGYLKNFDPVNYPIRKIRIINPEIPLPKKMQSDSILIATYFNFLSCGNNNIIALKSDIQLIKQIKNINIVDSKDEIVAALPAIYNGFTSISFVPDYHEKYRANIEFLSGVTIQKSLPPVDSTSFFAEINFNQEHFYVSMKNLPVKSKDYSLSICKSDFSSYITKPISSNENPSIKIPIQSIVAGINFVTISEPNGKAIYSMACIVPENRLPKISLTPDKDSYDNRQKVSIRVLPENPIPLDANFQVSVIKHGLYNSEFELLNNSANSDKRDSIEINASKEAQNIFFNLQFKDGHFFQKNVSSRVDSLKWLPEPRDLTISGLVRMKDSHKPIADINVLAAIIDKQPQLHCNKSDRNGSFIFNLFNLTESKNIYVTLQCENPDLYEILLNNDFSTDFFPIGRTSLNVDTTYAKLLSEMLLNKQLNKSFPQFPVNIEENTAVHINRFGKPDYSVTLDDYIDLDSFEEVFKEIVPFVKLRRNQNKLRFEVFDQKRNIFYNDPLVMIDEIPVFDYEALLKIHPKLIEKIEVIDNPYIYGDQIFKGIIFIQTNTKNFGGISLPSSSVFVEYQTITPKNTFHSRDFLLYAEGSKTIPDYRTTLYWNPSFQITSDQSNIEFYTSDHTAVYDVIVTYLSVNGPIEVSRTTINVHPN